MKNGSIWAILVPTGQATVSMQHWVDGERKLLTPQEGLKLTLGLIGGFIAFWFIAFFWAICRERPSRPRVSKVTDEEFRSILLDRELLGQLPLEKPDKK